MLYIKNIEGKVVFSTPINKGCKRKYTLMQEDYISLLFNVAEPIYFNLGDSIYDGQFEITDLVSPRYNDSTAGYEYEVKFDAYYWKWKNKKFFYAPEFGAREAAWSLTANLDTQLSIIIKNLNHLNYTYKGKAFEFSVDSTVKNVSKPLRYDNLNIIEALNLMAQTWECEWWVADNIIHFGRCEYGTPVDFELNNNVEKMSRNEGKRTFATRVYAFGSERNITRNYRPVDSSITTNGIVQKRLMLPVGTPYIDAFSDMTSEEAVEQIVIFDDVYPKLISKVSNVEVKESSVKDKETLVVGKLWTYFISDDSLKFDKKYILPDTELRLVFQSGALNGLDFAVGFAKNRFEIIRNEEYGRLLPDDILKPKVGDEFVLYGYDTTFVSDALLPLAEQELKERAIEFVEKSKIDPSTYECHMMSDYMLNGGKVKTFEVGDRVRLINKAYFKDSRVSRIIGYEYPLDRPYDSPIYLVGETASYSHLEEIKADVKELTYKEKTFSGSGSNVYVIGQYDSTPPTDRNTLSSQKSLNTFHRKDITDETDYLQKFNKGAEFGQYGKKKGAYINEEGIGDFEKVVSKDTDFKEMHSDKAIIDVATINELIAKLAKIHKLNVEDTANILKAVVGSISSEKFVSGFAGEGFRINQAINGDWNLEIDNLIVRKVFQVFELLVQEIKHQGGTQLYSPAGGKITKVTDGGSYWKCEIESADTFFKDDLVICQRFTGTIKRYWRAVTSVGTGYINLSKSDCEAGSSIPEIGDEIAVQGNKINTSRQSVYIVSVVGADSPYTACYSGINSYSLKDKLVTREGNLNGIIDKDFGQLKGYGLYANNAYLKGILRLTNGKTVEQELLTTNNNVEANRLELGGQIDNATAIAKSAQDSINGLEIGNKNYFSLVSVGSYAPYNTKPIINGDSVETTFISKTQNILTLTSNGWKPEKKDVDDFYVFSGFVKINGEILESNPFTSNAFNTYYNYTRARVYNPSNGYFAMFCNIKGSDSRWAMHAIVNLQQGDVVIIEKPNLQKGNKPTDWTRAEEDYEAELDKQITSVRTDFDVIEGQINMNIAKTEQLVNQTNGLVEETKQTATQVNQTATEINQNVSRAEESATRAEIAETNINTKADGIVMEASRQSAEKAIDGVMPEIEATNSKLELLSDKFSVEVAKTDGTQKELTALTQDHDKFKVQVIKDIDGAIDENNKVIKSEFVINEKGLGFRGNEIDMTGRVTYTSLNAEAQGKIDDAKRTADNAAQDIWDLRTEVGDLAYENMVSLAKLDNTIIEGGYIKTSLIEANSITADKINVQSLESVRIRTGNLDVLAGATIAGFKVAGTGLTNEGFNNDAYIVIRNDPKKVFTAIGANVHPATSSFVGNARFEIETPRSLYDINYNVALNLKASGCERRDRNIAINIEGGSISGFGLTVERWSASDTMLTTNASFILDYTTGHRTKYIPSPGETWVGRVLFFKNINTGWLQIRAKYKNGVINTDKCFQWGDGDRGDSKWSLDNGQVGMLINEGTQWYCSYLDWQSKQW